MKLNRITLSVMGLSILLLVILAAKVPGNGSQFSVIRGQVADTQGNPLAGYVIEAISPPDEVTYAAKTGVSGKFAFSNLHEGVWSLRVKCYSTTIEQREIALSKGMESEVDFTIEGAGSVSGFLLDSVSRAPLPIDGDVYFALLTKEKEVERFFHGRASGGGFEVKNLLPGRYVLIDAFRGYVLDMPEEPVVTVYPNGSVGGIEVLLKRGAAIHGRLVDEANAQPISDLEVKVASEVIHSVRPDTSDYHSAQTGEDGKFWVTTPNDPDAYYVFTVMLVDSRYQGKIFRQNLQPGQSEYDLGDIPMRRVLSLTGKVSDPTGGSVEGLQIKLMMHNKPGDFFRAAARTEMEVSTDRVGNFVFEELYPIEYTLMVSRNNITVAFWESVNPQKQPYVNIRLKKTQTLRGRVVGVNQQPLADAQIRAMFLPRLQGGHGARLATAQTDAKGLFQLQVLKTEPALLSVDVSRSGYFSRAYQNVHITKEELVVPLEKGVALKGRVLIPLDIPSNGYYAVKLFPANLQIDPVINPFLLRKPLLSKWFQVSETTFTFDGLPEDKYTLYLVGDGIAASGVEVDVTANGGEVTVLADHPTVTLQGRVLWAETGQPVVKALVSRSWYPWELEIYDISMTLDRFETETDEQGNFAFSNLTQGRYLLHIRYADAAFEKASGSYKKTIIHKQVEIPACGQSYILYWGRRDGISFVSETAP